MKLKKLIKYLTDVYNEHGNLDIEIMREGENYPEIEIYVEPWDKVYIEAYKENEWIE